MVILTKKRKPRFYEERIYIKDGKLQQLTNMWMDFESEVLLTKDALESKILEKEELSKFVPVEIYVEYTKVTKEDIFAAIEEYLLSNPKNMHLQTIITSSIKNITGIPICLHCKTPKSPNSNIMMDDPLYTELVEFIQNLDCYKELQKQTEIKRVSKAQRVAAAKKAKETDNAIIDFTISSYKKGIKSKNKR